MLESLRSVSDHQILANTDAIIAQDRRLTLQLLLHLNEIERRQLHLASGYSSMFDYCTTHLRLSEPAAARRLRTARCLARFPQLRALLESGEVNLSTVSMVAKYLRPENVTAVLVRICGRSRREVERVVAELEPRASLPPDRMRTVVVAAAPNPTPAAALQFTVAGDSEKAPTLGMSTHGNRRAGDGEISPAATVVPPNAIPFERRAVVQFSAREVVMSKLQRVRSIASHRLPGDASLEQAIEFLADYFIEREDPATRHSRREMRKRRARKPAEERAGDGARKSPRNIPVAIRDQVFVRDQRQCTYVGPGGNRCGSAHVLQIDHINPVARGGGNTADNLRLLCAYHNRLEAERLMGRSGPPKPR